MKFLKRCIENLEYSPWGMPMKYLLFYVLVIMFFWFALWQVGNVAAAYVERKILKDAVSIGGNGYEPAGTKI